MARDSLLLVFSYLFDYMKNKMKEIMKYIAMSTFRAVVSAVFFVIGTLYVIDYIIRTMSVYLIIDEATLKMIFGLVLIIISYLLFPSVKK